MKPVLTMSLCAMTLTIAWGCGKPAPAPPPTPTSASAPDAVTTARSEAPPAAADPMPKPEAFEIEAEWAGEFIAWERIGPLKRGMPVAAIDKALGAPGGRDDVDHNEEIGEFYQTLRWPDRGLEVTIGSYESREMPDASLFSVEAIAPSKLTTRLGVGIGTPEAELRKAYGKLFNDDASWGPHRSIGVEHEWLRFEMKDGKVARIIFGQGWPPEREAAPAETPAEADPKTASGMVVAPIDDPATMTDIKAALAACVEDGGPELGPIAKAVVVQATSTPHPRWIELTMEKQDKRVVLPGPLGGGCEAYPIGRAIAGGYGDFLGDGRRLRAFLVPRNDDNCDIDQCPAALIIRDKDKNFLRVTKTDVACSPAGAKTVKVLDDRDALEVECNVPVGGMDYMQHVRVYAANDKELTTLLSFRKGYSEGLPETGDDGKEMTCRTSGPGYYKVTKRGTAPVVQVFEPDEDTAGADKPPGTLTTWTWDAAATGFRPGDRKPHVLDKRPPRVCQ